MDSYSPWKLRTEGSIRDLNKGDVRKMVQAGAPKQIWEDELEFEAFVRSNTALDIYMLQEEVPETVMLGGN